MRRVFIVFFLLGSVGRAESDNELRTAIMQEMNAIMSFAQGQAEILEGELHEFGDDDDLWYEMVNDDIVQYRSISLAAQKNLEEMEKGLGTSWAKLYVQLLRNKIYAHHSDTEELKEAGIKRRSRSLLASGIDLVSSSSSFLIKCAGTIVALKTMYEISPTILGYFMQDTCSAL